MYVLGGSWLCTAEGLGPRHVSERSNIHLVERSIPSVGLNLCTQSSVILDNVFPQLWWVY